MKIVIAPDSFKESLTALQVAQAIEAGIRQACPDARTVCLPMADGGEGTTQAIVDGTGGELRHATITGALGEQREAAWGWLQDRCAVIEMAQAAGLEHAEPAARNVRQASSAGVGELILAALDAGAQRIILGLGGSSTNDGGSGMMVALGARLSDAQGKPLAPGGAALAHLAHIDLSGLDARLKQVRIELACDVDNPLCGASGASAIFGPQKGATPEQVIELDGALQRLAEVMSNTIGHDHRDTPGAGAAGGLGFAGLTVLNAAFRPGVALVAELTGLAQAVSDADLVFTGEGRMDAQTLHGKTPVGVARVAQAAGVPVIALVGSLGENYQATYAAGITAAFSLVPGPMTLAQACDTAAAQLTARACDIMRLWVAAAGQE